MIISLDELLEVALLGINVKMYYYCLSSEVMETSAQSSGDHQEQHVSVQEMQELKDTLNQAETKAKSLESQVENLQKV